MIKALLAKKTLIAIVSGVAVVSTVTYVSVFSKPEPELITIDQLRNDVDLRNSEKEKCKERHPMEAMQDPVCQLVAKVEKEERRKGGREYTYKGEPPVMLDKLPGRP